MGNTTARSPTVARPRVHDAAGVLMRNTKQRRALAALAAVGVLVAAGTTSAAADDGVRFIDGFENPEDLAEVPHSPWVMVSSWQDDGYVSAVHKGNERVVEVYPGAAPRADQDME